MSNTFINNGIYDDNTVTFYSFIDGNKEKAKYVYNNSMCSSGCHLSTSEDLIKLGNGYLFPNRILKQETLIELIKSQKLIDNRKTDYGMGFDTGKDIYNNFYYGHGGSAISARSELKIYPNSKLVVVVLANKSKTKEDDLVEEIANNYIEFLKELVN